MKKMKELLVGCVVLLSSASGFAGTVAQGPCFKQASTVIQLNQALSQSDEAHLFLVGVLMGAGVGELDPYELGDGGLMTLTAAGKTISIYDEGDDSQVISKIATLQGRGLNAVAVSKACLEKLDSRGSMAKEMKRVSKRMFGGSSPTQFFRVR